MTTQAPTRRDVQLLLGEARRYLATVDTFRAEGCAPSWRPEHEPVVTAKRHRRDLAVAPPIP
jgi:hypothetical protein